MTDGTPPLFTPFDLRGTRFPNRVVISPMCQYSAHDGLATDWHFAHLSSFALGGAGCVFFEAAAVVRPGTATAPSTRPTPRAARCPGRSWRRAPCR